MMHANCKISNLAHACLGYLCKFSINTPRVTGVLYSYKGYTNDFIKMGVNMDKIQNTDKKRMNKVRVARFILRQGETTKQEIAGSLGISMPTVLQNVKELVDSKLVIETGEYQSTGGRKPKALAINGQLKYAVGLDITKNHISYVLIDLTGRIVKKERNRKNFENTLAYYEEMNDKMQEFIDSCKVKQSKILGVGLSIPGIIDLEHKNLIDSHILQIHNLDLEIVSSFIPYETYFENDANSAAFAEISGETKNVIFLSLSNTVGGSIYMNQEIYKGDNYKSAEFGHMIIETNGKECYCGKKGCIDAYCSAKVLSALTDDDLELFFAKLKEKDAVCTDAWDEYLEYLAITITNLRMAFDCDIILGGYVGAYLKPYAIELSDKMKKYNLFEKQTSYVQNCRYQLEASAVGAAMKFVDVFFEKIE